MAYYSLILTLSTLAALFTYSEALRCWSCSSDVTPCADFFNASQLAYYGNNRQSLPRLDDCQQSQNNYYPINQKAVCMKKKMITGRDERVTYIRQCAFVSHDIQMGTCPQETTNSAIKIDFCEYCDHDGCNGASAMEKSALFSLIVPTALYFYLRK